MKRINKEMRCFFLEKYFFDKNISNFVNEFKGHVFQNVSNKDICFQRFYTNSNSLLFYPKQTYKTDKKSILLVTHELSRTGAPIVVLDTAKILSNNGYFVTVISLSNGPLLEEFLNIGVPVVIMPDMKHIQYFKMGTEHFFDKMDLDIFINGFDLVFMITATLYNFIKRYFQSNKRIIWWIHEGSASYDFLDNYMPKYITPNIRVVCGGEYAVHQLKLHNYHYYPTVLNYGVFDDAYKYKKVKRKNDKIRFLIAGSVGTRKGQLILLDSIKDIPQEYRDDVEFIFVGEPCDGDIRGMEIMDEIQAYADKNNNVIVLKSVPREELYKLYCEIDVLVLASIDDPMPVVATENFMLSNVCLCSTNTGTSYYIDDGVNGFVFESNNYLQLLEKIIYIIEHKDNLNDIKKNGRKIYDDYFNINIFEKNLLNVVEEGLR